MIQIFVIHGGNASPTHEDYLEYLRNKEVNLEGLLSTDWKTSLQKQLGDTHIVYQPKMPNRQYARYAEWNLWFEKFIPLMENGVIFIGHSLGGIFLAKYLSEETFPKRIRATFFVAAPFNRGSRPMADFILPESLEKMNAQAGDMFFYHSEDDHVVPFSDLNNYKQALPTAHTLLLKDRGHFTSESFPEIVEEIKKIRT